MPKLLISNSRKLTELSLEIDAKFDSTLEDGILERIIFLPEFFCKYEIRARHQIPKKLCGSHCGRKICIDDLLDSSLLTLNNYEEANPFSNPESVPIVFDLTGLICLY